MKEDKQKPLFHKLILEHQVKLNKNEEKLKSN